MLFSHLYLVNRDKTLPKSPIGLAIHFSLVLTARFHGLDPIAYYIGMLKRLPYCMTSSDYAALLPWNWTVDAA